jgi:sulfate adenylyltransferase subunit 1 (EFTu-like GTPase family)
MPRPSGGFLAQQNKDLLRFLTCGSVDDGKSTLVGLRIDMPQLFDYFLISIIR